MSAAKPDVRLTEVDATNWSVIAEVEPRQDQRDFVAPITRYLCLAHYGGEWHPLAIEVDGTIVGHVMWAVDEDDGSTWLGGLVIDAAHQGRGVGKATVAAFLDRFADERADKRGPLILTGEHGGACAVPVDRFC